MWWFVRLFSQQFVEMNKQWKTGAELSASWTVEVGDLDEASKLDLMSLHS